MKASLVLLSAAIMLSGSIQAQIVVPATPQKFDPRLTGGGVSTSPGVQVIPKDTPAPKQRYITYIVLSDIRVWSAADGRTLQGKLIAFEDLVVETPKGSSEPTIPPRPKKPTVIQAGKARLLIKKKTFKIDLVNLSQDDQEFIHQIEKSIAKQAKEKSAP